MFTKWLTGRSENAITGEDSLQGRYF